MSKELCVFKADTKENGEFRFIVNTRVFREIQRIAEQESIEEATRIFNQILDKNLEVETFKNILEQINSLETKDIELTDFKPNFYQASILKVIPSGIP